MKLLGFLLVTVGFIGAALAAVLDQSALTDPNAATGVDRSAIEDANATAADESAVEAAEDSAVKWMWYVPALALGVAGVVMIRTEEARHEKTEHHVAANIEAVQSSLERIAANIEKLNADKDSIDTYDMRHRVDELFVDDLEMFVDARESIAHRYGLAAYGNVMSSFAAGERYLNRVWSASADGYIDEVNEYLQKAKDQFAESLTLVRRLPTTAEPA
ncbi:MAG: hypothetical protein ACYS8X_14080 [Planctomycetota bacterium]|jgi:hypothetical protein